jgi:hypothetical protein
MFLKWLKNKVYPEETSLTIENKKYYKLIQNIKNFKKLEKEEINFMKTLNKPTLLDIIKFYDENITLVNGLVD